MDLTQFPPPGYVAGSSQVAGIDIFLPASQNRQLPEVVDFKCPKCGATIAYSVEAGKLSCPYCGYSQAPDVQALGRQAEQFEFKVETVLRSQQGWGQDRKELACQRCGGVVSVPPDTLAYTCPFCESNKVLYREPMEDVLRPRALIPFKIDPSTCQSITQKWLGNSWMLPGALRSVALDTFHPIYIPYWTFDAVCSAVWRALVIKKVTEEYEAVGEPRQYYRTVSEEETGKIQKEYTDLLVPGTTRLNMKALSQMDNYDIHGLVLYEPGCLAGMQAQAYDLSLEDAWQAGRHIMRERTRLACLDRISSGDISGFRMSLDFRDEAWRYILVPIYTNIYRYGDRTYQILVNGQTGRIAGPRPIDWQKVWLVIAAILAPGILIGLLGLWMGNDEYSILTSGLGMFLLVIGVVVSFFTIRQAQEMEHD